MACHAIVLGLFIQINASGRVQRPVVIDDLHIVADDRMILRHRPDVKHGERSFIFALRRSKSVAHDLHRIIEL